MNTNTTKNLVTSLEWLREAAEIAFEKQAEPVFAKVKTFDAKEGDSISEEQDYIYESTLNQYEKAVLLYMHHYSTWPQTVADIAEACSISTTSVKRVIKRFMDTEYIMRAPFEPGYILTKFS